MRRRTTGEWSQQPSINPMGGEERRRPPSSIIHHPSSIIHHPSSHPSTTSSFFYSIPSRPISSLRSVTFLCIPVATMFSTKESMMATFLLIWLLSPVSGFSTQPLQNSRRQRATVALLQSSSDSDSDDDIPSSTSIDFAMGPTSPEALKILRDQLGISLEQHKQLAALAVLVVDWNTRINLVSRRDCTKEVVFGRHILPSLAPLGLSGDDTVFSSPDGDDSRFQVVDVGTGGGFPGLPLAIAYPECDFLLVDSIGKKLGAVQDMADRLGLKNVQTHHGRAEVLAAQKGASFDLCVGRSVAAIPTYCFWIQKLLKRDTGKLLYMIGGDIEQDLLDQADIDQDIDDLLQCPGASDKRVLVFPQAAVRSIAAASGEKIRVPLVQGSRQKIKRKPNASKSKRAKGEWSRRDDATPKQRGAFSQRFDSLNSS